MSLFRGFRPIEELLTYCFAIRGKTPFYYGPYTPWFQRVGKLGSFLKILPFTWNEEEGLFEKHDGCSHIFYAVVFFVDTMSRVLDLLYTAYIWNYENLQPTTRMSRSYMLVVHCWTLVFRFFGELYKEELRMFVNKLLILQSSRSSGLCGTKLYFHKTLVHSSTVIFHVLLLTKINIFLCSFVSTKNMEVLYPGIKNRPWLAQLAGFKQMVMGLNSVTVPVFYFTAPLILVSVVYNHVENSMRKVDMKNGLKGYKTCLILLSEFDSLYQNTVSSPTTFLILFSVALAFASFVKLIPVIGPTKAGMAILTFIGVIAVAVFTVKEAAHLCRLSTKFVKHPTNNNDDRNLIITKGLRALPPMRVKIGNIFQFDSNILTYWHIVALRAADVVILLKS